MARTRSITNEQILEAARVVFLEHGAEAKTSEIARRAGISEGTIFKRFGTKEQLFMAAMKLPPDPDWTELLDELVGRGDLRANLERVAEEMIEFFVEILPKMHMIMSQKFDLRAKLVEDAEASPPIRALKKLAYFFDQEQRLGRLRRCDSEVLARAFVGALHHYSFAERCGVNEIMPMPRSTYARGVVAMLLDGVIAASEEAEP